MALTPAEWIQKIRTRYSQFSAVLDAVVTVYIEDALLEVDEETWGALYERGVLSYVCHAMTVNGLAIDPATNAPTPVGNVTSLKDGSVSVSFVPQQGGFNEDWFLQTACGKDHLRMMNLVGMGIVVIPVGLS